MDVLTIAECMLHKFYVPKLIKIIQINKSGYVHHIKSKN